MLRHKAAIQCGRYAFGLSGIIDPDEAERFQDAGIIDMGKAQVVIDLITPDDVVAIQKAASEKGLDINKILNAYNLNTIDNLPLAKFAEVMDRINKFKAVQ
jgi:hypothetical protein